jgi:tRNA-Thr(GGU) m(6)t(6)A37 methyltransferase TsaA
MHFEFEPIGLIHSCFKEKFGIPRQSRLIPEAEARLEILAPYNRAEAFRELDDYSHLWILFVFHASVRNGWKPTVRPPRLGGNKRVGVFASRSPARPNPIGLSVVDLLEIDRSRNGVNLHLAGVDLLNGTPVLDIKPYLPYTDALPDARAGYAPEAPQGTPGIEIHFSAPAEQVLGELPELQGQALRQLVRQMLALDPRPGYRQGKEERRRYGTRLLDFDLQWEIAGQSVTVLALHRLAEGTEP